MAKFYPAPSGGGTSDFVVEGDNTRGGNNSEFDDTSYGQTAIGSSARATSPLATAFGVNAVAEGEGSTSVGSMTLSVGVDSLTIGHSSYSYGTKTIVIGSSANAEPDAENGIAIGTQAEAKGANAISIGKQARAQENEIVIGSVDVTSLAFPGVGFFTSGAQDGDILGWSDTGGWYGNPGFTWAGPEDKEFEVVGGTLDVQPTFNGDPLFDGSYVKTGKIVHFRIDVNFSNILTFGTGQYYLNLPFTPKYNYMFTGGCLHDASTGVTYVITGHVFAGNPEMRLESTDNTGNSSFNIPFTSTAPIALETTDNFHIYGDYIVQ
jgi:hypothetical protein